MRPVGDYLSYLVAGLGAGVLCGIVRSLVSIGW